MRENIITKNLSSSLLFADRQVSGGGNLIHQINFSSFACLLKANGEITIIHPDHGIFFPPKQLNLLLKNRFLTD